MEDMIDKLINLENRAQAITVEAKEKEKTISQQIKAKQEELENRIFADYSQKIDEMTAREKLDEQQKILELERKKLLQLNTIQKEFEQNHLNWEEELFNSIIGR